MFTKTASFIVRAGILAIVACAAHAGEGRPNTIPTGQPATADCDDTYVADCGFETGASHTPGWTSTSTNFGTVFCSTNGCGTAGGPMVPRSGTWFGWFGGTSLAEAGTASQVVTLPSGQPMTLSFWYTNGSASCVAGPDTAYIEARIDGTTLWRTDAAAADYCRGTYAQITVDIPAPLLGGTHTLEFHHEQQAMSRPVNFGIDDVSISIRNDIFHDGFD